MVENNIDRELGWDDQIEKDSQDYTLLPEGDYDFEITGFERARYAGGDKLPSCWKAIVSVKCKGPGGITTMKHNLFLHTKVEGLLCQFFTSIGQRKKGERITMDWDKVVGSRGRCKLGIHKWTTEKGEEKSMNQVVKFYEPGDGQLNFNPGEF